MNEAPNGLPRILSKHKPVFVNARLPSRSTGAPSADWPTRHHAPVAMAPAPMIPMVMTYFYLVGTVHLLLHRKIRASTELHRSLLVLRIRDQEPACPAP